MNKKNETETYMNKVMSEYCKRRNAKPDRLVESGWTDTYWDGSFGPVHKYEIWDRPGLRDAEEFLENERQRLMNKNSIVNEIFKS